MSCPTAYDESPGGSQLSHIQQLGLHSDYDELLSTDSDDSDTPFPSEKLHPPVLISNGLPPIPFRLVKRVEDGLFVEMAELLPSYLDSADFNTDDQRTRKRLPVVSHIIDWVQCFAIYMAIISRQKSKRVADLLGYQSLIIGASQDCHEGQWVTYDHRFRLKASASRISQWSVIDVTIWNMTFPEKAIQCHQPQRSAPYNTPNPNLPQQPQRQNQPICLDWNDSPNGCSRASCRYKHISYHCVHNPRAQDKHHKASQCTYKQKDR